jgi:Mrp family chromosome partitioning ATPase
LKANPGVIEHVQPVSAERLLPNSEDAGLETRMEGHRPTYVDNLQVMTSGPPPPNPAELLGSGRMKYVINQLRRKADIILFDSPPVLAVADAAVLATQVDGVLIVNDAGRTRRTLAKRAVERLRGVDAHLLGVVLNRLPSQGKNHYYYYAEEEDRGRRTRRRRSSRESQADPSRGEDRLREGKEPV